MAKCKWKSSSGAQCTRRARQKFAGYCSKEHADDGGKGKPKSPEPKPKGDGGGIAAAGGVARLLYYSARLWEIIEDHWPDLFSFLSAEQMGLCKKIASRKTDKDRTKLLADLFSSLKPDQWIKLLEILATVSKSESKSKKKRTPL